MAKSKIAVIIGNRVFFPDHLIIETKKQIDILFNTYDIETVMPDEKTIKLGAVENLRDARACADLFRKHRDDIDGILVSLPNFGDEKGIAETIRSTNPHSGNTGFTRSVFS